MKSKDYIKREDVLEAVKEYFHGLIDAGAKDVDVVDCGVELQRVIGSVIGTPHPPQAVPLPLKGKAWIRVEDKLPEDDGDVLVILNGKYGNITFVNAIQMGSCFGGAWFLPEFPHIENPKVSHWMELPDGPENGER